MTNILTKDELESISVSSVLQKNHREYGKKHLYDGKPETCWNSDQGLPQSITVKFPEEKSLAKICMVSQGGFCPREIVVYFDGVEVQRFEAKDINLEQEFDISEEGRSKKFTALKLEFPSSSDFYGRIVIYELKLMAY